MATLTAAELRWRTRRVATPAVGAGSAAAPLLIVPQWLNERDEKTAAVVAAVRGHVAGLVGQERQHYRADAVAALAGDRRLGAGLALVCGDWYRWSARAFAEVLPAATVAALVAAGITFPSELRLRLFDIANQQHGGFVPSGQRDAALAALAAACGLPAKDGPLLDAALRLDRPGQAVLTAPAAPPTVAELVAAYNRAVFNALLRHAERVQFVLAAADGALVRRLFALCRRLGIYCEWEAVDTLGGAVRLTLAGSDAVAGPPATAGPRLGIAARRVLTALATGDQGRAELSLHGRPYVLMLDRELLKVTGIATDERDIPADDEGTAVPSADDEGTAVAAALYDSSVETALARSFAVLRRQRRAVGWRLLREPAPLPVGRRVLVPDFALVRGDLRVFVEIAGFWTPGYLAKKRSGLAQLPADLPFIIAVPEEHAAAFAGLTFPLLTYRTTVNLTALLALAEQHYGDFAGRTADAEARLHAACAAAEAAGWLSEGELAAALGCLTPGEISRVLEAHPLPAGWRYLPGSGLLGRALCDALDGLFIELWPPVAATVRLPGEVQETMSVYRAAPDAVTVDRLTLAEVRQRAVGQALPAADPALVAVLSLLSTCRVQSGSLFTTEVLPPRSAVAVEQDGAGVPPLPPDGPAPKASTRYPRPPRPARGRGRPADGVQATLL